MPSQDTTTKFGPDQALPLSATNPYASLAGAKDEYDRTLRRVRGTELAQRNLREKRSLYAADAYAKLWESLSRDRRTALEASLVAQALLDAYKRLESE